MWKLVVGFVVFAAIALFVISKGGDSIDMGGEKHGTETAHEPVPPAPAPVAVPVAPMPPATEPAPK